MIEGKADSKIYLRINDLTKDQISKIKESLTISNPERRLAEREQIGGWWKIPENIFLYKEDDDELILPRGFASDLDKILNNSIKWKLDMNEDWVDYPKEVIPIRSYQEEAIQKIIRRTQGVWQSPPGSGKTVTVLEAIRHLNLRALVIVNTSNIAEQWRDRTRQFLGIEAGLFGDGVRDEKDLTIALQQTLWSKRDELESEGWFNKWGFVCLDEVHHLPANTFTDIIGRFNAWTRIGVSGTPYKQSDLKDIVNVTVGPLIHVTEKNDLVRDGWLIKPRIQVWETDFDRRYIPTHKHDPSRFNDRCSEFKYCERDPTKKRHQNNYSDILSALIDDDYRNNLIAENVSKEVSEGHTVLVLSKRIKHLETLNKLVQGDSYLFTGKQNTEERMRIQERAEHGSCVLFSTIADEALDIPRASRIHLAWPTKNTDIIRQQMGRIERPHPEKKDAVLNDYLDTVGPLRRQFEKRYEEVYVEDDLQVEVFS